MVGVTVVYYTAGKMGLKSSSNTAACDTEIMYIARISYLSRNQFIIIPKSTLSFLFQASDLGRPFTPIRLHDAASLKRPYRRYYF